MESRIAGYIRSLDSGHGALCDRIAMQARADFVPVIRPETAAFLKTVVAMQAPGRILEVGTAVGYSALLMAQVMPEHAHITTIEKYKPRILKAREHFKMAGEEPRISLIEGNAEQILQELTGPYDFIFMDAAKGQYIHWLPRIQELMLPGAVLFSDNVLQEGDILESRYAVTRRDRTIHARMRDYLYTLTHTPVFQTSVIPIGDGVAVSVKRS